MKLLIFTDGASRGNPGPAGCGFVIYDEGKNVLFEGVKFIGNTTNNVAEYRALLEACRAMHQYEPSQVEFYLDSELVVKQMRGEYKVRDQKLAIIREQVLIELKGVPATYNHIPRKFNKEADALANQAIDAYNMD